MLEHLIISATRSYPSNWKGWDRLAQAAEWVTPRHGKRELRRPGVSMWLDLSEYSQRAMYMGCYEPGEAAVLMQWIKPGNLFVDLGAQFGYYTALARSCGARTISFEPTPRAFTSVASLGGDARQVAIGSEPGRMEIWINSDPSVSYDPSLYRYTDAMIPVEVTVDTLDNQLREEPVIDLIKIDIEGHEMAALAGARETLSRTRMVYCEFNERMLNLAGSSSRELYAAFEALGFRDEIGRAPELPCENRLLIRQD